MFEPENNIPIAAKIGRKQHPKRAELRGAIATLKVSQSLLIPKSDPTFKTLKHLERVIITSLKPRQFAGRTVDDGFRIWRIA